MRFLTLIALVALPFLAGCRSCQVTKIMVGDKDEARPIEHVKVVMKAPENCTIIATLSSKTDGDDQEARDMAIAGLKKESADLGADYLLLRNWKSYSGRFPKYYLNADALHAAK